MITYHIGRHFPSFLLSFFKKKNHSFSFFLFIKTFTQKAFSFLNALFPSSCPLCSEPLRTGTIFCWSLCYWCLAACRAYGRFWVNLCGMNVSLWYCEMGQCRELPGCLVGPEQLPLVRQPLPAPCGPLAGGPHLCAPSLCMQRDTDCQSPKEADVFLGSNQLKQCLKTNAFLLRIGRKPW